MRRKHSLNPARWDQHIVVYEGQDVSPGHVGPGVPGIVQPNAGLLDIAYRASRVLLNVFNDRAAILRGSVIDCDYLEIVTATLLTEGDQGVL
jgi:hypothetical protein